MLIDRRGWVRAAGTLIAAPFLAGLYSLVSRATALRPDARAVTVPGNVQPGVTFVDDVIVCRDERGTSVFAARCTHLGCRIAQQADDLLICPCHGSRFHLDGSVAHGPATRPLERLAHHVDPKTGAITVTVG